MPNIKTLQSTLKEKANLNRALILQRFFKTGPGEYGEGDKFLGIYVPYLRKIAKEFANLNKSDLNVLIKSKWHEERMVALLILIAQYKKAFHNKSEIECKKILDFYIENMNFINSWDLVDTSAPNIVGHYFFNRGDNFLTNLAKENNLWHRRIAIIATFYFIKQNYFATTINIATILLRDKEDLIHKACGWMLREIGKRDLQVTINFLKQFSHKMPRTMLRYAIEKMPQEMKYKFMYGS